MSSCYCLQYRPYKRDGQLEGTPKVKPKCLDCPLVVGCSPKPLLISGRTLSKLKTESILHIIFFQRWILSFYLVLIVQMSCMFKCSFFWLVLLWFDIWCFKTGWNIMIDSSVVHHLVDPLTSPIFFFLKFRQKQGSFFHLLSVSMLKANCILALAWLTKWRHIQLSGIDLLT